MLRLVFVSILVVGSWAGSIPRSNKAAACPDSILIDPCVCTLNNQDVDIVCSDLPSLQALTDIFGRAFPTNELHSIVVKKSRLAPLPNDVFRGKSFQIVSFIDNRAASFENPTVLSSSSTRLTSLVMQQDTEDWIFNFANIQGFNALTYLEISGYLLSLSGTISSPGLNHLVIRSGLLEELPAFGSLPALSILDLDGSSLAGLPTNSFATLTRLTELYLGHNKIVSLNSGSLSLDGQMAVVDLSSNLIDEIQPGWITGVSSTTSLQLLNNYIRLLDQSLFEELITAMLPSGKILLDGNPLACGCEIAWVVTNTDYKAVVSDARCVNGTRLVNLDPNYFLQNC